MELKDIKCRIIMKELHVAMLSDDLNKRCAIYENLKDQLEGALRMGCIIT